MATCLSVAKMRSCSIICESVLEFNRTVPAIFVKSLRCQVIPIPERTDVSSQELLPHFLLYTSLQKECFNKLQHQHLPLAELALFSAIQVLPDHKSDRNYSIRYQTWNSSFPATFFYYENRRIVHYHRLPFPTYEAQSATPHIFDVILNNSTRGIAQISICASGKLAVTLDCVRGVANKGQSSHVSRKRKAYLELPLFFRWVVILLTALEIPASDRISTRPGKESLLYLSGYLRVGRG